MFDFPTFNEWKENVTPQRPMEHPDISQEGPPETGTFGATHHDLSVPEHVLIPSGMKDDATGVGVDPMDM